MMNAIKKLSSAIGIAALMAIAGGWANYNPSGDIQAYNPGSGGGGNPNGPAVGNVDWGSFYQTSTTGSVIIKAPNGVGVYVVGNANITGSSAINGSETVVGNSNILGTLNANGVATFQNGETVAGNSNFLGTVNANGAVTWKSNETVTGNANFLGTVNANGAVTFNSNLTENGNIVLATAHSILGQTSTIVVTPITSPTNLLQLSGGSFPGFYLGTVSDSTTAVTCQYGGTLGGRAKLTFSDGSLGTNVAIGTSGSLFGASFLSTSGNSAFSVGSSGNLSGLKRNGSSVTSLRGVLATESGNIFDNQGASGQVEFDLPAGALGLYYTFSNAGGGATWVKIVANGSDKIAYAGTLGSAGGNLVSAQVYSDVTVVWVAGGYWKVIGVAGTAWTLT